MPVMIELPPQADQVAFNLKRWEELSRSETLAGVNERVETDRYGHVIMSPYAGGWHGALESEISYLLKDLLGGRPITECPISTSDGVKLADVGWYSPERFAEVREHLAFPRAPEICVEVVSPSNTEREISEKRRLYFEAGCEEFWRCDREGNMRFFDSPEGEARPRSGLCPDFPNQVEV